MEKSSSLRTGYHKRRALTKARRQRRIRRRIAAAVCLVAAGAILCFAAVPSLRHRYEAFGELVFSPATAPELVARWQAVLFSASRDVIWGDFQACRGVDLRDRLAPLRAAAIPSLMISGRDDLLVPPELCAETAACLPAARHEIVSDSGHLTHLEQPAACFALIEKFLGEFLGASR